MRSSSSASTYAFPCVLPPPSLPLPLRARASTRAPSSLPSFPPCHLVPSFFGQTPGIFRARWSLGCLTDPQTEPAAPCSRSMPGPSSHRNAGLRPTWTTTLTAASARPSSVTRPTRPASPWPVRPRSTPTHAPRPTRTTPRCRLMSNSPLPPTPTTPPPPRPPTLRSLTPTALPLRLASLMATPSAPSCLATVAVVTLARTSPSLAWVAWSFGFPAAALLALASGAHRSATSATTASSPCCRSAAALLCHLSRRRPCLLTPMRRPTRSTTPPGASARHTSPSPRHLATSLGSRSSTRRAATPGSVCLTALSAVSVTNAR